MISHIKQKESKEVKHPGPDLDPEPGPPLSLAWSFFTRQPRCAFGEDLVFGATWK